MTLLVRSLCLMLALAATVGAQFNTFPATDYFREQWVKAPLDMEIESVSRLEDFQYDGKLELSLRGYIELRANGRGEGQHQAQGSDKQRHSR